MILRISETGRIWKIINIQKRKQKRIIEFQIITLKPFGTMRFGLTKSKLNFLATTKEGIL